MDAILATPITPVAPAPVNEVQAAREDTTAPSGFDQALKQEIKALKPEGEPKDSEAKKDADNAAAETLDSTGIPNASEAAVVQAFAAPAPIAPSFVTLPTGDVLTSGATVDEMAEAPAVVSAEIPDDPRAIESEASDAMRMTQTAPQFTAAQQSVREQRGAPPNMAQSNAAQSNAAQSNAAQSNAARSNAVLPNAVLKQNSRGENGRDSVDHPTQAKSAATTTPFTTPDYMVQAQLQAYEPERGMTGELPAAANHFNVQPDAISSASLATRWNAQQPTVSDASYAPASARIDTPVGTPGWADAFQQKMVWLVDRQQQSAELHINPPHLGPVEIMLNIGDEGANIMLCSPHAAVREAIEASLPDLRASLAERGLSLGQASVGSDSSAAREQFAEQVRNNSNKPDLPAQASLVAEVARLAPRGLVDIYA